jgi:hypothetical protein
MEESTCIYLIVMFGYYHLKKKIRQWKIKKKIEKKNINKIMFNNNIQDKMTLSVSYLVIASKT